MIIKEIYIGNFGKLSGFRQKFSDTLNLIVKENGYGKTTVAAFIKAMLYGIESNRKQSLLDNPRKRYTPWQGGYFGGWMIYEAGGREYKVERSFGTKASLDTITITDMKTGKQLPCPETSIGESIFEIDEEGFDKTVFLSETNLYMNGAPDSVSARLAGITGIEGDVNGFDEAIELLDKQRKTLHKKGGAGLIRDAEENVAELERALAEINTAQANAENIAREINIINTDLASLRARRDELLAKKRSGDEAKLRSGLAEEYAAKKARLLKEKMREDEIIRFFSSGIPEISEITRHEGALAAAKRTLEENSPDIHCEEIPCPFENIPDEDKITELSLQASGAAGRIKFKKVSLTASFVMLVIAIGAGIGGIYFPALFAVAGIFAICTVLSFAFSFKRATDENGAEEYIRFVYGRRPEGDIMPLLITMRGELEAYTRAKQRAKREYDFAAERKALKNEKARKDIADAQKFLSLFPTVTEHPFEEIRRRLYDLATASEAKRALTAECSEFEMLHGTEKLNIGHDACIDPAEIEALIADTERSISSLEQRRALAESDLRALLGITEGRVRTEAELSGAKERADGYRKTFAIITKTQELLAKAKTNMTARYLDKTRAKFTEYTSYITYDEGEFTIDTDFQIKKSDQGALRPSDSYSRGQRELYQLALRLALVYSIYEKELPPIILDDPFISLDDSGAARGLELLRKLSAHGQIIYFSCSSSRG